MNGTLKLQVSGETKLQFYIVKAVPTLLYVSETWVKKNTQTCKIQAKEFFF